MPLPNLPLIASLAGRKVLNAVRRIARRRAAAPGLNTIADAEEFIATLHPLISPSPLLHHRPIALATRVRTIGDLPPVPAYVEGYPIGHRELILIRTEASPGLALTLDMRTPIFDGLVRERRARVAALRMPTQEMRIVFDALVDRWLCSHCEAGDCELCPGCSCSCKLLAGAR